MAQDVYTVPEYCELEKVSRSKVYQEWAAGGGVAFFKRGNRILISNEARLHYRAKLEKEAHEARAAASKHAELVA